MLRGLAGGLSAARNILVARLTSAPSCQAGGARALASRSKSDAPDRLTPASPYKPPNKYRRYGYETKTWSGGLLPRNEEVIRKMPQYKPRDNWSDKKALFGQNDYIDILGPNDSVKPVDLVKGPPWVIGFKGHEFRRLLRRMRVDGDYMREFFPQKHHAAQKRLKFLYKKVNRRRRPKYIY